MSFKFAWIPPNKGVDYRMDNLADYQFPCDLDQFKADGVDLENASDEFLAENYFYKIEPKGMPDLDITERQIYLSDYVNYTPEFGFHRAWSFEPNNGEIAMEEDEILAANRFTRNRLLLVSDYTQGSDSPLTDSKKAEWATYRQELRDLPTSLSTFNSSIITDSDLPTKPE